EYRWVQNGVTQAAPAPDWLIALAKATKAKAWARAALDRECKSVAAALPGTRNTTLNIAAFNLFQIVAGRGLDEQEVRDRLFEAAETCRLVADDGAAAVEATIESGAQAGKKQPRTRPQPLSLAVSALPFKSWTDNCYASWAKPRMRYSRRACQFFRA